MYFVSHNVALDAIISAIIDELFNIFSTTVFSALQYVNDVVCQLSSKLHHVLQIVNVYVLLPVQFI